MGCLSELSLLFLEPCASWKTKAGAQRLFRRRLLGRQESLLTKRADVFLLKEKEAMSRPEDRRRYLETLNRQIRRRRRMGSFYRSSYESLLMKFRHNAWLSWEVKRVWPVHPRGVPSSTEKNSILRNIAAMKVGMQIYPHPLYQPMTMSPETRNFGMTKPPFASLGQKTLDEFRPGAG